MSNGMSTAIAMHGSRDLSKAAKRANERLLKTACFGPGKVTREMITGSDATPLPTNAERAMRLRGLAKMAGKRQAKILLKQAAELEPEPQQLTPHVLGVVC